MMTGNELLRLRQLCRDRPGPFAAIEVGCWLGESSKVLLQEGAQHLIAVDLFRWQTSHQRKLPGLLNVGEDFRALTVQNLRQWHQQITLIEADSATLTSEQLTSALPLLFGLIDGPKAADSYSATLQTVLKVMPRGAVLAIKHAVSPQFVAIFDVLAAHLATGQLTVLETDKPAPNDSLLSFTVTADAPGGAAQPNALDLEEWIRLFDSQIHRQIDLTHSGQLLKILKLLKANRVTDALAFAHSLPYSRPATAAWMQIQTQLHSQFAQHATALIQIEMALAEG